MWFSTAGSEQSREETPYSSDPKEKRGAFLDNRLHRQECDRRLSPGPAPPRCRHSREASAAQRKAPSRLSHRPRRAGGGFPVGMTPSPGCAAITGQCHHRRERCVVRAAALHCLGPEGTLHWHSPLYRPTPGASVSARNTGTRQGARGSWVNCCRHTADRIANTSCDGDIPCVVVVSFPAVTFP